MKLFSAGTRSAAKKSWQNYNRMDQTSEMGIAPPYVRLCQDLSLPLSRDIKLPSIMIGFQGERERTISHK